MDKAIIQLFFFEGEFENIVGVVARVVLLEQRRQQELVTVVDVAPQ